MTRELLTLHLAHCFPVSFVEILKLSMRWSQIKPLTKSHRSATTTLSNNSQPATLPNLAAVGALKAVGFLFVLWSSTLGDLGRSRFQMFNLTVDPWTQKDTLTGKTATSDDWKDASEQPTCRIWKSRSEDHFSEGNFEHLGVSASMWKKLIFWNTRMKRRQISPQRKRIFLRVVWSWTWISKAGMSADRNLAAGSNINRSNIKKADDVSLQSLYWNPQDKMEIPAWSFRKSRVKSNYWKHPDTKVI